VVAALVSVFAGCATLLGPSGAGATSSTKVLFSHVTVTAAKKSGESAVVMTIDNRSGGPISLLSVTSSVSRMNMIYFDTNMCQGNHAMIWLQNILIMNNHVQALGYQYQGAMLSHLNQSLKKGSTVPLEITWSNYHSLKKMTVKAHVVAAPKTLRFHMSAMNMSGMNMNG